MNGDAWWPELRLTSGQPADLWIHAEQFSPW